ncbi:MAG TPA: GNAT family N-acetyltransferase [Phototrophicaceae bacterium]|jgi:GNAT superfamily N-acetyltransferase|nr:GNAT family N-acetyltransferase [Phototrophicaceae bacterium]
MPDLLVKLYTLPPLEQDLNHMQAQGILLRRAIPPEKHIVLDWVKQHFSSSWTSECDVAFHRTPPTCWLAIENNQLIGFGCYDVTSKGFFGPTGVAEAARGRGAGKALLMACLHALRWDGYGYAIIGDAGPVEFYQKIVGAVVIEDSTPGVYNGMLRS